MIDVELYGLYPYLLYDVTNDDIAYANQESFIGENIRKYPDIAEKYSTNYTRLISIYMLRGDWTE